MIDFIAQLGPGVLYPAIFLGIIFLGGLVLIPAMYLSITGSISLTFLLLINIIAAATADSFWYAVGKVAKKEKLYTYRFIKKRITEAERFSAFFTKHGVLLVFLTKFIYGTRIASHVLAGMHKIRFYKFLGATAAGTGVWFGIFYLLLRSIDTGLSAVKEAATRVQLLFLAVLAVLVFINWFTGSYIRQKIMKNK
jgi:membrane protein DedA with SNARE-associated domain